MSPSSLLESELWLFVRLIQLTTISAVLEEVVGEFLSKCNTRILPVRSALPKGNPLAAWNQVSFLVKSSSLSGVTNGNCSGNRQSFVSFLLQTLNSSILFAGQYPYFQKKQARSYISSKLLPADWPTESLTEVKCRATSVSKKQPRFALTIDQHK